MLRVRVKLKPLSSEVSLWPEDLIDISTTTCRTTTTYYPTYTATNIDPYDLVNIDGVNTNGPTEISDGSCTDSSI